MTKIDSLRRFLLPCYAPSAATATATAIPKKRLSTSLRDDFQEPAQDDDDDDDSASSSPTATSSLSSAAAVVQPRPSKTMVIGTIFGHRRGHVWFCVQHDRLSTRPALLLELSVLTHQLVKEMRFGLVRITLECDYDRASDLATCPLRSVPLWAMHCNGRKLWFAARRKAADKVRLMLKVMESTTVGAGALPAGFGFGSGSGSSESEGVHEVELRARDRQRGLGVVPSDQPGSVPGSRTQCLLAQVKKLGLIYSHHQGQIGNVKTRCFLWV